MGARTEAFHRASASSSSSWGKAPAGATAPARLTAGGGNSISVSDWCSSVRCSGQEAVES